MFSIVVPLYNKAAYIEKAIISVMSQTYKKFELIVVDDGSKDESLVQLSVISYQLSVEDPVNFKKIKIVQQENQGVSTARNNGVKLAKYDYIAFLDADDWWEPTYLEEMKSLIDEFSEAVIFGSSYFKVKNGINIPANIGVENGFKSGIINYCKVYYQKMYMPLWTGATIIKKTIFESENGFKPTLKLGEDFDLWIRVALKYQVALLNEPLAYYNQDVDVTERGVVFNKLYKPETHFVFNLEFLESAEQSNQDLKKLLDLLRVYTLERYRLQKAYKKEVDKEIAKVDFSKQATKFWFIYHLPVWVINIWYYIHKKIYNLLKNQN